MLAAVRTFANETLGGRGRMGSRVRENDGDEGVVSSFVDVCRCKDFC